MQKPVVEPPQVDRRLQSSGYGPVSNAGSWISRSTSSPTRVVDGGGHTESLRRRYGEIAGEELGADLVKRNVVNVGTALGSLFRVNLSDQVRCRPMASREDGAFVVVRDRESRLHGEGKQQTRSQAIGTSGGRR